MAHAPVMKGEDVQYKKEPAGCEIGRPSPGQDLSLRKNGVSARHSISITSVIYFGGSPAHGMKAWRREAGGSKVD